MKVNDYVCYRDRIAPVNQLSWYFEKSVSFGTGWKLKNPATGQRLLNLAAERNLYVIPPPAFKMPAWLVTTSGQSGRVAFLWYDANRGYSYEIHTAEGRLLMVPEHECAIDCRVKIR